MSIMSLMFQSVARLLTPLVMRPAATVTTLLYYCDLLPRSFNLERLLHPLLMIVGFILPAGEVFKFHHELEIPDMYTSHSWLGMSTICLFGLQWLSAFFSFWWPGAEMPARARLAPLHVFLGTVIFLVAILSAETGLVEKFLFLGLHHSQEALIVNFTGPLILLFGVSVGLTVLLPGR